MNKERERLRTIYTQTFNTKSGQAVLEDLKGRFFWYDTTYEEGKTQLNEGGRKVLLTIENIIKLPKEQEEE